jgi:hypothetical protein
MKNFNFENLTNLNIEKNQGVGDWGLGIGPNPQSPIPNPQSPIYFFVFFNLKKFVILKYFLIF